jgi:hypothetical protein
LSLALRVLRIFGHKRDEIIGGWRKLHNGELHNLYFSPSIIRMIKLKRMRLPGNIARMKAKPNAYRVLVENAEGEIPLRRPRRRWEENNKLNIKEIRWGGADWIHVSQNRDNWMALVSTVMNLRVP